MGSLFQRLRHLLIPTEDAILEATGALVDMDIEDITMGKEKLRQMLMHIEDMEDLEEDIEGDTGDRAFNTGKILEISLFFVTDNYSWQTKFCIAFCSNLSI